MKVGIYSESPADRAAIAVFVEAILGEQLEPIGMDLEAHGVGGVLSGLDGVFRGVYYRTDAEGFVIVVDADDTPLHEIDHDLPGKSVANCRRCRIVQIVQRAQSQLKPRPGRPSLKVAVGVAVPAIEAWYLLGKNHQVGEAAWKAGLASTQSRSRGTNLSNWSTALHDRPLSAKRTMPYVKRSGSLPSRETSRQHFLLVFV